MDIYTYQRIWGTKRNLNKKHPSTKTKKASQNDEFSSLKKEFEEVFLQMQSLNAQ